MLCSWAYMGILAAWALMTVNWLRLAKLYKKQEREVDGWMDLCDELYHALLRERGVDDC